MRRRTSGSRSTFIVLSLAGFLGMSIAVALSLTRDVDRALLNAVQGAASFPLDLFSSLVTITGRAEITGALALLLTFLWRRREGAAGWAPLVLFVAVGIEAAFKYLVPHGPPPSEVLRDFNYLQVVRAETPYAYPSGHAVRATFLSVLLAERVPWTTPLVAVYVAMVCVTRVYVGAHWPSDVLGGLFFGALAGFVATPAVTAAGRALARLRSK